jgi:hypothetical protein
MARWRQAVELAMKKMAEVLCVYREVQVLKKAAAKSTKPGKPVAIVSRDEKPGIQAIANDGAGFAARTGRLCELRMPKIS